MGSSIQIIDYAALAEALRLVAPQAFAGTGADSTNGVVSSGGSGRGVVVEPGALASAARGEAVKGSSGVKAKQEGKCSASWADEVQESEVAVVAERASDDGSESSGGSVTFSCDPPVASGATCETVKFGGLSDEFPQAASPAVTSEQASEGFYARFVRDPGAIALRKQLVRMAGGKMPKCAHADIAVCSFAAGVMPSVAVLGKKRLKTLAAVGDAAITMHLVMHVVASGGDVESAQAARSKYTSNAHLREVMLKTGLVRHVRYPSGVDPKVTAATATAFEAIVGVLSLYRPVVFTQRFLQTAGVLVV